jgi:predicted CXXCH cytochrome family protein
MKNKIKYFLVPALFLFLNSNLLIIAQTNDECFKCHVDLDDTRANLYKTDIHHLKGISCAACHGGDATSDDMDVAMSEVKGFIGVPQRSKRYEVCISCHTDENKMKSFGSNLPTDQFEYLKVSVHFQPTFNNQGPIADCITCHSVHDIRRVNDPASKVYPTRITNLCGECHSSADYMKNYNPALPVDQIAKYRTSIHGKLNAQGDPNAAECASCHGSHEIQAVNDPRSLVYATNIPSVCANCHSDEKLMAKYKIPTDQFEDYVISVHGVALLEKGDLSSPSCNDCHGNHGAIPPEVESISKVCGTCHVLNMELFEQSPHKKAFDENDLPECETCHGNHLVKPATDAMVGTKEPALCIECHSANDDNDGYMVAAEMKLLIDSLKTEDSETKIILDEAVQKGMDVSDATFSLQDVRQVLIQSRTTIHTFSLDQFKEQINEGYTIVNKAKISGEDAIDEFYYRRIGLGVSTLLVTLLVIGLYIKLKKVEKKS